MSGVVTESKSFLPNGLYLYRWSLLNGAQRFYWLQTIVLSVYHYSTRRRDPCHGTDRREVATIEPLTRRVLWPSRTLSLAQAGRGSPLPMIWQFSGMLHG